MNIFVYKGVKCQRCFGQQTNLDRHMRKHDHGSSKSSIKHKKTKKSEILKNNGAEYIQNSNEVNQKQLDTNKTHNTFSQEALNLIEKNLNGNDLSKIKTNISNSFSIEDDNDLEDYDEEEEDDDDEFDEDDLDEEDDKKSKTKDFQEKDIQSDNINNSKFLFT